MFPMKEKILDESISGLMKEGLRFSIDTVAKKLRISKKTVYKYFSSKEDLARAVYDKYYYDMDIKINELKSNDCYSFDKFIVLYYQSFCMTRPELFNKFSLNKSIRDLAIRKHGIIMEKFSIVIRDNKENVLFIINSVFEKLNGGLLTPELIKMLEILS